MTNKRYSGVIVGTGAIINVGLGFRPDWVRAQNISGSDVQSIYWHYRMAAGATALEGIKLGFTGATAMAFAALTAALGIAPYDGGDLITTASASYQVAVRALTLDPYAQYGRDVRNQVVNSGGGSVVSKWNLDTLANRTGHFDAAASTTYVKAGSIIDIKPYSSGKILRATIVSITSTGTTADYVTLDRAIASGLVQRISYAYDFMNAPAQLVMPEGFRLAADADVNANGELILIEAGVDDNAG